MSHGNKDLESEGSGAGDGNRTHVRSLGSSCSTIELHPRPFGCPDQTARSGMIVEAKGGLNNNELLGGTSENMNGG